MINISLISIEKLKNSRSINKNVKKTYRFTTKKREKILIKEYTDNSESDDKYKEILCAYSND